ncbi:MAG: hypothetical protein JNJ57_11625, partial [Saprospiraceae bacterium]|nr:hypothetical protein [Saprospiraceae bacterium]
LFLLLLSLAGAAAGQHDAQMQSDSNRVETGNPFVLHLSAPAALGRPDSTSFAWWVDVIPKDNILSSTQWRNEDGAYRRHLTILFFDADTLQIPPFYVYYPNGDSAVSNALDVLVYPTPSPDDLNDLAPIKDILREPSDWTDYAMWIGGILAILGLAFLVYWILNRRKQKQIMSRLIQAPPHELALRKLDKLEKEALWTKNQVKEHCAQLTYIIREYLEKRYELPALESTSEELARRIEKTEFPVALRSELAHTLTSADLAKFAKGIPPDEFYQQSLLFAKRLVQQTIPVETPP